MKRNMGTIVIQEQEPGTNAPLWQSAAEDSPFKSVADAEKWIRAHGENQSTYRIIRVVKEFRCEVEQITKRKLV